MGRGLQRIDQQLACALAGQPAKLVGINHHHHRPSPTLNSLSQPNVANMHAGLAAFRVCRIEKHQGRASMETLKTAPNTVDKYIAAFSPQVQVILRRIRQVVREAAPEAQEVISYRMPALKQQGILVYFAAFKNHIGLYPPATGDTQIQKAIAPYAGEKGNLRFPFDKPIPYDLIARITELRLKQNLEKAASKHTKVRP